QEVRLTPATVAQQKPFFPPEILAASQTGEFRHIINLFVSLQGDIDDEQVVNLGQILLGLQERYGGLLNRIDFGDKGCTVLLFWGAPVAHEDDLRRALSFLLDLEAALDVPLRAGVTQAVAHAGVIGSALQGEFTCYGNGINLAARLMMAAEWGAFWVSKAVSLAPGFDFTFLGPLRYKGFADPVPTYQLKGKAIEERVFAGRLVGRRPQLERLVRFVRLAFAQKEMRVAVVYGEAGMGKSHLTYTLEQRLGGEAMWLVGQNDPVVRHPFGPFAYLLRTYFEQKLDVSEADNKQAFEQIFADLLMMMANQGASEEEVAELRRVKTILGALVGLQWPDSLYMQLNAEQRHQNMIIAITDLLEAESRRQPVVLEIEDGQWFDDSSLELLSVLTKQLGHCPLVFVITSRYMDDGSRPTYEVAEGTRYLELDLQTLTPAAMRALGEDLLGMAISDELYTLLVNKAAANPFFGQQILYYLQENELLTEIERDGERVMTLLADNFNLPTTLNTLLVARLDRLTHDVKEVVQTAAVLGREFELGWLRGVLGRNVTTEISVAEQEQVWTLLADMQYLFKHALLKDAAYKMQLQARLRELHYKAAEVAEQIYADSLANYYDELAYHYETAYQFGKEEARGKGVEYLWRAAEAAAAQFEHQLAIQYTSRALAMVNDDEMMMRWQLLQVRETAYDQQGDREKQLQDLNLLTEVAEHLSNREKAYLGWNFLDYYFETADYEAGLRKIPEALRLAEDVEDFALQSRIYHGWARIVWDQGDFVTSEEKHVLALKCAEKSADKPVIARCMSGLGRIHSERGEYAQAKSRYEKALQLAREAGAYDVEATVLNQLGVLFDYAFDYEMAQKYFEQSLHLNREIGNRTSESIAFMNLGFTKMYQGDYVAAKSCYEQALVLQKRIDHWQGMGVNLINLGSVATYLGSYEEAESLFEESLSIFKKLESKWGEAICLNEIGFLFFEQGEWVKGEAYCQQAQALQKEIGLEAYLLENRVGLGWAYWRQGDEEGARQYATLVKEGMAENPRFSGCENPMRALRRTWELFRGVGEVEVAKGVLAEALVLMNGYLDKNQDERLREMYLSQPHHQVLWAEK
ncbi:MAG TPA: tetratricopeptide repeat protein, partial [Anaerolineae bacterium]|nr:tetratricopeptide repeat protein [Anaerolineae bacterium]